jgi:small subunit ribosomal protein S1
VAIQSQKSHKPLTMAELMASHQAKFVSPKKGDLLLGTIKKLSSAEITVDIGAKTEAVVLEKDKRILKSLLGSLKLGDSVTVSVLNPESDFGYPVVSLRRFNEEKIWEKLEALQKEKTKIEVIVDEATKGGFMASSKEGISGFLPNSQVSFLEGGQSLVGKAIEVAVIELNRALKKVILSQKATVGSADFEKSATGVLRGQKLEVSISNVAPFGIFTAISTKENQKLEGFIHISEVSWEKLESIPQDFKPGDKITVEVLGLDKEAKRVNLSIKRLTQNPYEEKLKQFTADKKVSGTITKIMDSGMLIDLGEGIEGFVKKEKIPPTVKYVQGSSLEATVLEVDKKQRVILAPVLKEKPIGYR